MKNIFSILCIILLSSQIIWAQQSIDGAIEGSVIDVDSGNPIEFATISIYNEVDSNLVTGSVSDLDGLFSVDIEQSGSFYAVVEYIGFSPITISDIELTQANPVFNIKIVELSQGSLNLDEVVVQETRSQMQMQIDKRVFNADASLTTRGSDALELLGEVPSVEVDADGVISLRGSTNVNVLIDGRPSGIPASQLLQSIPAAQIDRIEIITNPSARYEAEGMAGILNVILKKNRQGGITGTVGGSFNQGIRPRTEGNASLAYKNDKLNAYVNYGYNRGYRYSVGSIDKFFTLPDTSYSVLNTTDRDIARESHSIKTGLDFYLNDKNTLYISGTFNPSGADGPESTEYLNYDENDILINGSRRVADKLETEFSNSYNLGWLSTFSEENHKLEFDAFYNESEELEDEFYEEEFFDSDFIPAPNPTFQNFDFLENTKTTRISLDYTQPFANSTRLEAGYRFDNLDIDNNISSSDFDYETGEYVDNLFLTNRFLYTQNINAAYATFGGKINSFSYQAGLRYEYTILSGDLVTTGENFDQNFGQLFPSASIMYTLAPGKELNLSYSKRVRRPDSRELNPFTDYSDPYNLWAGNPNLDPELMDALELSFMSIWEKVTLNASIFGNYTKDEINRFIFPFEDGVTLSTYENVGESVRVGAEFFMNYNPYRWWRMNVSGNIRQNTFITTNVEIANNTTTSMSFNYMSNFTLKDDWSIQFSSRYRPGFKTNQGKLYSFFNVDMAISKDFLDRKLSVTLSARDFLNTLRFKYDVIQSNIVQQTYRDWDSRRFGIAVAYRFGQEIKDRNERGRNENDRGGNFEEM